MVSWAVPQDRLLRKLWGKVVTAVTRGQVTRANSTPKMQLLNLGLHAEETTDEVEHFEPYGFTSRPKAGSEAIVLKVGADGGHPVAIVVGDRRFRVTGLAEGEVAIHNDATPASTITLKANGDIVVDHQGDLLLGAGSTEKAVLGDALSTWLTTLLSVSTAMGPSGPAITGLTATQLSGSVKVKTT